MSIPLTSIDRCQEIAGLGPHEIVIGVSPSEKHERMLASYRPARSSRTAARARIVADLRAAVTSGATRDAADLLIVLRRLLALSAPATAPASRQGARRAGVAPLCVRTALGAPPLPARPAGGAVIIPFAAR